MTIETALVFPLFLFAMVMLMTLFTVMDRQRQVQAVLESVCEDISRLAYADYEIKRGETKIQKPGEEFEQYFGEGGIGESLVTVYVELRLRSQLDMRKIQGLSLAGSNLLTDGEMVDLVARYEIRLPFPVFRIDGVPAVSRSRRRAWVGKDGGWLNGGEAADGDNDDEIVYVGKRGTRYHINRECHYLSNQLIAVALEAIDTYRNESGGKYYACTRCGKNTGGTVYIMKSGSSYHSSASCSAIIAYVRAVKKSEAAHLGACSYCSGGGG